jgi:hypothetical protein
MKFRLFYKDIEIAILKLLDSDFPNLYGHYEMSRDFDCTSPKHKLLNDYIDFSIRSNELLDEDEAQYEAYLKKNENQFMDLIESEEWYLINEDKERRSILAANFLNDEHIIWRWRC